MKKLSNSQDIIIKICEACASKNILEDPSTIIIKNSRGFIMYKEFEVPGYGRITIRGL